MSDNNKQGGYNYEDFKSQEFKEPTFLEKILNYTIGSGVSTSEMRGAHGDIDKLIENADANAKIARIASTSRGRYVNDVYRILNPDSTIKILDAEADRYYDDDRYGSIPNATYSGIEDQLRNNPESTGIDKNTLAFLLAESRNNPYKP
tara:strand:+ start:203 stop:646 length:444 start_codon:yes stop_codon:yes gene_type:complete